MQVLLAYPKDSLYLLWWLLLENEILTYMQNEMLMHVAKIGSDLRAVQWGLIRANNDSATSKYDNGQGIATES